MTTNYGGAKGEE